MVKVVVMSDSHGYNNRIDAVLAMESDADVFLHCGDYCSEIGGYHNIHFVQGNNDYDEVSSAKIINVQGTRIYMMHSHQLSFFHREEKMVKLAKEKGCTIFCYGHTHLPHYSVEDGIHIINPGSLYHNRDGSDLSYVVIHIDEIIEVEFKAL